MGQLHTSCGGFHGCLSPEVHVAQSSLSRLRPCILLDLWRDKIQEIANAAWSAAELRYSQLLRTYGDVNPLAGAIGYTFDTRIR